MAKSINEELFERANQDINAGLILLNATQRDSTTLVKKAIDACHKKGFINQFENSLEPYTNVSNMYEAISYDYLIKVCNNIVKISIKNDTQDNEENPLHLAVLCGNVEAAGILIRRDEKLDNKNDRGKAPLHIAVSQGYHKIAKLLIESGADVNVKDDYEDTPLHLAAFYGNVEAARILIINGADLYAQDIFCHTPLEIAKYRKHQQIDELIQYNIQFSLAHGCKDDNPVLKSSFTEKPDNESDTVDLAGQGEFGGE